MSWLWGGGGHELDGMGAGRRLSPALRKRDRRGEQVALQPRSPDRCSQGVENLTADSAWAMLNLNWLWDQQAVNMPAGKAVPRPFIYQDTPPVCPLLPWCGVIVMGSSALAECRKFSRVCQKSKNVGRKSGLQVEIGLLVFLKVLFTLQLDVKDIDLISSAVSCCQQRHLPRSPRGCTSRDPLG